MNDVEKKQIKFKEQLKIWSEFVTETTKIAGVAQALNEIAMKSSAEKRYYAKTLFKGIFNQLVIHLYLLSNDSKSKTNLRYSALITEFEKLYGRLDKTNKIKDHSSKLESEYKNFLITISKIRHNFSAHINNSETEFNVSIDNISNFLKELCDLSNLMYYEMSEPEFVLRSEIKYSVGISTRAPNLETESKKQFLDIFLKAKMGT